MMNKFIARILLFFIVFGQLNIGGINVEAANQLENEKNSNIDVLDAVGEKMQSTVDSLDTKIKSEKISEKLREKGKEIEIYIDEAQKNIKNETNKTEIKKITKEAGQVAVLKIVSAITVYDDIEKSIDQTVASTKQEKIIAKETIQESLETNEGNYNLIVQTKYSEVKLRDLFLKVDETVNISKLYEIDGNTYYEINIDNSSIFKKEILTDIESGILPETFLGINIVRPEVFKIDEINLEGEDILKTWGVERYHPSNYLPLLENQDKKIRIGVVDTGIDASHPDLKENTLNGYNFIDNDTNSYDNQGHGTHVSGTIAAQINGKGIIGVNPNVELLPLKVCNESGFCPSYAAIKAIEYAKDNNVDILNMSLGGRGDPSNHSICDAITSAYQQGITIISAAGNSNVNTDTFIPAGCIDTIAVSAIKQDDSKTSFSNYGSKAIVSAPGEGIYSTYPVDKGSYKELSGTSMAAPHIAGLVSIIKTFQPEITNKEIEYILSSQGKNLNNTIAPIGNIVTVNDILVYLNEQDENSIYLQEEDDIIEKNENETGKESSLENENKTGNNEENKNILEYIPDFQEEIEDIDAIIDTLHYSLDDLTLEDINISNLIKEERELEVFDLNQIKINHNGEDEYINENRQNFSIAEDERIDISENSEEAETITERIIVPEIIGTGPEIETQYKQLIPVGNINIEESEISINSNEKIIIEEVILEETNDTQLIHATKVEEQLLFEDINIENISDNILETSEVLDPEKFVQILGDIDNADDQFEIPGSEDFEEIKELTPEEYKEIQSNTSIGIQSNINFTCDIYIGQNCSLRLKDFLQNYKQLVTTPDVVSVSKSSLYVRLYGLKAGSTYIDLFKGNTHSYRLEIIVREIPQVIEKVNCEVISGQTCRIGLSDFKKGSKFSFSSNYGHKYFRPGYDTQTNEVTVNTSRLTEQKKIIEFDVYHNDYKVAEATMSILPNVPKYECIILVGDNCSIELEYDSIYNFEYITEGIVSGYSPSTTRKKFDYVYITGVTAGETSLYVKNDYDYKAQVKVTVLNPSNITIPVESCTLSPKGNNTPECQIEIVGATKLEYLVSNGGIVSLYTKGNTLGIQSTKNIGDTQITVKHGNITVGIIEVTVDTNTKKYICELNLEKECDIYLGKYASSMEFIQTSPGLVDIYRGGYRSRDLYIKAKQEGKLKVYVWNKRTDSYTAQLEITISQPTRIDCKILEGGNCAIEGLPYKFNYEERKDDRVLTYKKQNRKPSPQYAEINTTYSDNTLIQANIEGFRSGEVDIGFYKYGYYNEYEFQVIDLEIIESPINTTSFCETRVNGNCSISLRNIGTDKYTVMVTTPGIIITDFSRDAMGIKGAKEGTTQILIQNNETNEITHRGEVIIEGFYKITIPKIKTELSITDVTLKVGESKIVDILEGNNVDNYRLISTYPNVKITKSSQNSFNITAENSENKNGIIYLVDKDNEYANAKIYLTIEDDNDGGDHDGGDSPVDEDQTLGFHDFSYEALSDIEIGLLHFKVTGNPNQVGIQYVTSDDSVAQEILTANDNGLYSLVIDKEATPDSETAYSHFMPFYTDENNDIYYYDTDNYLSFSSEDGKGRVLDNLGIESIENIGVQESNNSLIFNGAIQTKIDKIIARIIAETQIHGQIPAIISRVKEVKNKPNISVGGLDLLNYLESGLKGIISNVEVTSYEYTENVEDGYIGGLYFQVNDPNLIQEVGIEYYNNVNYSNSNIIWKKEVLENEGDGEFASFILPKTKFTNVRGYVIDNNGGRIYTNIGGDIIIAGTPLLNYYNTDSQVIASEDNIEVSALPLVPIAIFIGSFAISAYSSYQCEQEGYFNEEGWLNLSCGVAIGSTLVSLASLGQGAIKLAATKFATKESTELAATSIGKSVDDIAKIGATVKVIGNVKFSNTQLQKKYLKHSSDFGITGNYNPEKLQLFKNAIISHINDKNTKMVTGLYDSNNQFVFHFYNSISKNNVMFKRDTYEFISGWKLSDDQIKYLLEIGHIK